MGTFCIPIHPRIQLIATGKAISLPKNTIIKVTQAPEEFEINETDTNSSLDKRQSTPL
jgi:hypothetical protein